MLTSSRLIEPQFHSRDPIEIGCPTWSSSVISLSSTRRRIIERLELGPAIQPSPPAAARPAAATRAAKGEVFYGGPTIRRNIGQVLRVR